MADVDTNQEISLWSRSLDHTIGFSTNGGDGPEEFSEQGGVFPNSGTVAEEPTFEQHEAAALNIGSGCWSIEVAMLWPAQRDGADRPDAGSFREKPGTPIRQRRNDPRG
jgi:hypothetical protein